ncbi:hypothetical protein BSLG_010248 [Batrachochytrium salamandrivorans]|nr:hypothetical protein BSLG_010248 [Batrachochytrium salamandrivorans]
MQAAVGGQGHKRGSGRGRLDSGRTETGKQPSPTARGRRRPTVGHVTSHVAGHVVVAAGVQTRIDASSSGPGSTSSSSLHVLARPSHAVQQQTLLSRPGVDHGADNTLAGLIEHLRAASALYSPPSYEQDYIHHTTASTPQLANSTAELSRLRLLVAYHAEDVLVANPQTALQQGLDDILWSLVYQQPIQTIRSELHTIQTRIAKTPKDHLQHGLSDVLIRTKQEASSLLDAAASFYRTLILELDGSLDSSWSSTTFGSAYTYSIEVSGELWIARKSTTTPSYQDAVRALIHNSLVILGDIERYRFSLVSSDSSTWNVSRMYYEKALGILPFVARPHSQIAMLYSFRKDHIQCIYHSMIRESTVIRSNLVHAFRAAAATHTCEIQIAQCLADLLLFTDKSSRPLGTIDKELLDSIAALDPSMPHIASLFVKLGTMFMIASSDLGCRFDSISLDRALERQEIRYAQAVTVAGLLSLLLVSLGHLSDQCGEDDFFDDLNTEGSTSSEHLVHLSLISAYLAANLDQIKVLQVYSKQMAVQSIQNRLSDFTLLLAIFVNSISSFADMDGSLELTPEDTTRVGLECMRGVYTLIDKDLWGRHSYADNTAARLSRVSGLAQALSQDTKQQKIATMRALASERLRDQVNSLQQKAEKELEKLYTVAVLDAEALISDLSAIKLCLMQRSCAIAIQMDVIQDLDKLKTGSTAINARARDCIRYLEQRFKYRSPFLLGQQPGEVSDQLQLSKAASSTRKDRSDLGGSDTAAFVPDAYKGLISYCLYVKTNLKTIPNVGRVADLVFVSNNSSKMSVVMSFGISCMSTSAWRSRYTKRGGFGTKSVHNKSNLE